MGDLANIPLFQNLRDAELHALDAERKRGCEAYGVAHTPMAKAIEQYYGFKSGTFFEAMQNPVYKSFPPFQPDIWREWEAVDLHRHSHVAQRHLQLAQEGQRHLWPGGSVD